jgi:hypothetical protein
MGGDKYSGPPSDDGLNQRADPEVSRPPSAIDRVIQDVTLTAKYMAAVAAGNGADKQSPEFQSYRTEIVASAIGAAVGSERLYRKRDVTGAAKPIGEQVKQLEADARWFAAAAIDNLNDAPGAKPLQKGSSEYEAFANRVVDSALAVAVATAKLKKPGQSHGAKAEAGKTHSGETGIT